MKLPLETLDKTENVLYTTSMKGGDAMDDNKISVKDLVEEANKILVERGDKPTTRGVIHARIRNRGYQRWRSTARRENYILKSDAEKLLNELRDGYYLVEE